MKAAETYTDEMLAALERLAREQCEPGEGIEVHAIGCPVSVDEACECETLTIMVPKEQA